MVDAYKEPCFSYKKMGISAKSVDTDSLAVLSAFEVSPCGPEPDCRAEIESPAIAGRFISEFGHLLTFSIKITGGLDLSAGNSTW